MQFKAGYILDAIGKVITDYKSGLNKHEPDDQNKLDQIKGLLQYVSSFDVDFGNNKYEPNFKELNPVLATLNNIITRGLPTRAPILLENLFSEIGLTQPSKDEFEINFPNLINPISYESIFQLLHIIEPKLEINRANYGGNLGSSLEWEFIKKHPFLKQILESQRDFSTINNKLQGNRTVDFCFTSPYLQWNEQNKCYEKIGRIFEVDGPHHSLSEYRYYDSYRDAIAEDENFETIRFSVETIKEDRTDFEKLIGRKIYQNFKNNFEKDIKEHLVEYSLIFIPLAVARIKKTILEFLLVHSELFKNEKIHIAIIERDFPCGAIAVKSIQELFININAILKDNDKLYLPEIELTIFENSKWSIDDRLHLKANKQDETFFKQNQFNIIIDHSILRRSNIYNEPDFKNEKAIRIRSAHYFDTAFGKARRVYCAELLHYKPLVKKMDDGSYIPDNKYKNHINFFIQNIFRKASFREGQLPIISRALQQKAVIGLLPTGGGKSLTFQLPTFLQPGLCLVVDPIKSLMEDQVRVLRQNWIDCCDFINSNLKREEKAKKLIDFRYGETMFLFISPERFVMEDFRNVIQKIDISQFGLIFSYCVIDEVHCVSEWGHDFRSTYLMLGKNAQRFARTKNGKAVSLIGLTATASFDVLADIERELQIEDKDISNAIIMIENTIRPELFFRVINTTGKNKIQELKNDFANFGKNLDKINNESTLRNSQRHHFDEFEKKDFATPQTRNSSDDSQIEFEYNDKYLIKEEIADKTQDDFFSIIFCPTKDSPKGCDYGVNDVFLNLNSTSKGYFYAADDEALNQIVQDHFQNFTTDKIKHIVCTKAFGMGIDKKDIRSTYHYVYSGSLESLVQEAGRSGRDKKISESNILLSKNVVFRLSHLCLLKNNPDDKTNNPIQNTFHRKTIRKNIIGSDFEDKQLLETIIEQTINAINTTTQVKDELIARLKLFILSSYSDRDVHNFFYEGSFKGVDTEKSQLYNLFKTNEFYFQSKLEQLQPTYNQLNKSNLSFNYWEKNGNCRVYIEDAKLGRIGNIDLNNSNTISPAGNSILKDVLSFLIDANNGNADLGLIGSKNIKIDIERQGSLENTFKAEKKKKFQFTITSEKIYPDASIEICTLLNVNPIEQINPPSFIKTYQDQVQSALRFSLDFDDFVLMLEEIGGKITKAAIAPNVKLLRFKYSRDRKFKPNNDTGRLIYRMHSMGFLDDYIIDYNKNNLYTCTFVKHDSKENYIIAIEHYLRRYLSENEALKRIEELRQRLTKSTLVDDILECLYFLAEFSYTEIASKRKRATNEIEEILNTTISDPQLIGNWFQQNLYIKEQIYFYFNAKYARIGFKINGLPFSLLDDYKDSKITKPDILNKYTEVLKEGTAQNNYKHMMGSCKKILRSLSETDLKNEWMLRLLKAFSMYSVNNSSYISEANEELELGFYNLYKDENFHANDFEIIASILGSYLAKLKSNIQEDNPSFKDIRLIQVKLLLIMQTLGIEKLVIKNQDLTAENYA